MHIWSREASQTDVFQTPKYYSKDHGYYGLYNYENELYENGEGGDTFRVPSDWKIIIDYTKTLTTGNVKIRARVDKYEGWNDIYHKHPTRTYLGDTPPGIDNEAEKAYRIKNDIPLGEEKEEPVVEEQPEPERVEEQ